MSKSFWRVEWDIDGGKGPHTYVEYGKEEKAIEWADGILKAGGKGIIVTELIVGRTIIFNIEAPLFHQYK